MTRPTILDLDLVVVPAKADVGMLGAWYRHKNGHRFAGEEPARDTSDVGAYSAMLSASPYPTAWDDVRKYVEGLERERDEATGTLRYCEKQWSDERGVMIDKFVYERNRAEAFEEKAEAAERELSEIAGHMDSECDSDSILHVVREAEADRDIYKDRALAAEARIAELEADHFEERLAMSGRIQFLEDASAVPHLEHRIAELEAALDEKEVASGLTSNGNLWRFWSTKASALAARNAELEKRLADAGDSIKRMEWACEQLAATRTMKVYDAMIESGQAEALLELDNARRAARAYMEGK